MLFISRMLLLCFSLWTLPAHVAAGPSPVAGKKICLDAGHGGSASSDHYRMGSTGEREEWINLRVAVLLRDMLRKNGATVIMTRESDQQVPLAPRSQIALSNKADLFLSIHHNATADRTVNFPIIYFHGAASENMAGVQFGKILASCLEKYFYKAATPVSIVSDYTIFPDSGASVLRNTYGIPGLLAEASFFTNDAEETRLKEEPHNADEAAAYLQAIEQFFSAKPLPVKPKKAPLLMPPFKVFQEADRMRPEALQWLSDFKDAEALKKTNDTARIRQAYERFRRSARSFPDSYVARQCHENMADLLKKLHLDDEADLEKKRVKEFYVKINL